MIVELDSATAAPEWSTNSVSKIAQMLPLRFEQLFNVAFATMFSEVATSR